MLANLTPFLLHWALTALGLWVASHVFKGMRFDNGGALVIAALLLGLANAVVRPLLGKLGEIGVRSKFIPPMWRQSVFAHPSHCPPPTMLANLTPFLLHWALTALGLWVASHVFKGMRFDNGGALLIAALLLGLANAVVRPLLVFLTLPLTLITFGLFLLVINALMLMLVAKLVKGFHLDGFWTAFWASLFMSLLSLVLGAFILGGTPEFTIETSPAPGSTWL